MTEAGSDGSGVGGHEVKSPGLATADGLGAAFELKFQLDPDQAKVVEAWAGRHLVPDRHGDNGRYRVTSVYCDTPGLDVFHRSGGFRRTKFRIRRYDDAARVFLERKRKRGDRVSKRRTDVHPEELGVLADGSAPADGWTGSWFADRVRRRNLRPTACVTYRRAAFFGWAGDAPVRLTMDRELVGVPATDWRVPHVRGGEHLLPDAVLMELKFHLHMPTMFQDLLSLLPSQLARASKYRRCVQLCGIWDGVTFPEPAAAGRPDDPAAARLIPPAPADPMSPADPFVPAAAAVVPSPEIA